jgi:hypothetical protein
MRLDRVMPRDHSVPTKAPLSGAGGAPAAVTDGGGATNAHCTRIRLRDLRGYESCGAHQMRPQIRSI